jgi:predicted amidohydrolase
MGEIRVAVAQPRAAPCDIASNARTAIKTMREAAARAVDLVVFPELHLCGYDLPAIEEAPDKAALAVDSEPIRTLQQECRNLDLAVVIGACLKQSGGITNSALVIDASGHVPDVYDKINLWGAEKQLFQRGKRLVVAELGGWHVGVAICYDAGFPEHARALACRGADLITCPSAFAQGEEQGRFRLYFPARALENGAYVAVANVAGEISGRRYFGKSAIFDPNGCAVASAGRRNHYASAQISPARVQEVRKSLPYLADLSGNVHVYASRICLWKE